MVVNKDREIWQMRVRKEWELANQSRTDSRNRDVSTQLTNVFRLLPVSRQGQGSSKIGHRLCVVWWVDSVVGAAQLVVDDFIRRISPNPSRLQPATVDLPCWHAYASPSQSESVLAPPLSNLGGPVFWN